MTAPPLTAATAGSLLDQVTLRLPALLGATLATSWAYTYHYTGTTAAGDDYSSETAPKAAGSYTVNVAFTSETAIGTGSASFTIAPKSRFTATEVTA